MPTVSEEQTNSPLLGLRAILRGTDSHFFPAYSSKAAGKR